LGLWGWWRSNNKSKLAINSSQAIEAIREFIKTLPNGEVYDAVLTQWMQQHQADAGVLQQVITLLHSKVNNADAKQAAQDIIDALDALKPKV